MSTRAAIDEFLAQRSLAVVGVSRSGKKFGNIAYRELKAKGYSLIPVHQEAQELEGDRCAPSLRTLPAPVTGVLVVVPPPQAEAVVRQAAEAGIRHIWLQPGAESPAAIRLAESLLRLASPRVVVTKGYDNRLRWQYDLDERRVVGTLIEKGYTTPEGYPLTMNSLVTGWPGLRRVMRLRKTV